VTAFIACSFSSGLDDLPRKQQSDVAAVLRVLKEARRFSVFEATANQTIATMMTRLCNKGLTLVSPDGTRTIYGKLIETDNSCGYPWTKVKLTTDGERFLADATPIGADGRDD
jgi:hypothetical protein